MSSNESSTIAEFSLACERMNDFARTLNEAEGFENVRPGADIRHYESGWRLEKWVEAELDKNEGTCAVWWLELGIRGRFWVVRCHVGVSPDEFYRELPERAASSYEELAQALVAAVDDLKQALHADPGFRQSVRRWRAIAPDSAS